MGKADSVVIIGHQGLGDHIVCSGLYREYARKYSKCVLPVNKRNYRSVKELLKDVPNIQVISEGTRLRALQIESHALLLEKVGYDLLALGRYKSDFYALENKRFDEKFYDQAKIDFEHRWKSFSLVRNYRREDELFEILVGDRKPYVFVHDDHSRNFGINEKYLPKKYAVVRPDIRLGGKYYFTDYLKIIENAAEIHCMESSFAALIESCEIDRPKFAHRYIRPESKIGMHYEFTYKSFWEVLT
jgi:hypothetical protein